VDAKTRHVQQTLEQALVEIDGLREARRRHEQLMESVVQQRDAYRQLLHEAPPPPQTQPPAFRPELVTSTPGAATPARNPQAPLPPPTTPSVASHELEKLLESTKSLLQSTQEQLAAGNRDHQRVEKELRDKVPIPRIYIDSLLFLSFYFNLFSIRVSY